MKYEVLRGGEVESVETKWEMFRDIVKECTNDVCGLRCVGGRIRNGSEWWSEEVGVVVAKMGRDFDEWLQRRDSFTYDRYRAQRTFVKLTVIVA